MQTDAPGWQRKTKHYLLFSVLWLLLVPAVLAKDTGSVKNPASTSNVNCGAQQSTPLTPNSNSVATSLADINHDITVNFVSAGITYWTVLLSVANLSENLGADRGNAIVTFHQGLNVYLVPNGTTGYQVLLSGEITDDSTDYNITGKLIGMFVC